MPIFADKENNNLSPAPKAPDLQPLVDLLQALLELLAQVGPQALRLCFVELLQFCSFAILQFCNFAILQF